MQEKKKEPDPARPVIFGEVLFDNLPDGRAVLGGAPFNVAWHLQGLGLRPLLLSRIGDDAAGEQVLAAMQAWGMDTMGIQRDPDHPTGAVHVTLENGSPSFHILPDQAYDHIEADAALASLGGASPLLIYHGTLAVRSATSAHTLQTLRNAGSPIFVDVNLRSPWWDTGRVLQLLRGTHWLKLSGEELDTLTGENGETRAARARALRARYGLEMLVVTEGEAGAQVFTPFGQCAQTAVPADPLVDTVGAGDAFSAVCLVGIALGWPLSDTLGRAAELAARICTRPGATHADRMLYADLLERWAA